jgi:DNA recombination protein RmuC
LLGTRLKRRLSAAQEAGVASATQRYQGELDVLTERLAARERELSRLEGVADVLTGELEEARDLLETRTAELADRRAREAALEARLEEADKAFREKETLFRESRDALKREFELLAGGVFEQQERRQEQGLQSVLAPLKDQLAEFRRRVEEVYHTESKDRASLLTEVRSLQQASKRINTETENLTRALKGDVKLQGNWGEVVLERILEDSGLRAGREYFLQETHRSADGQNKRPDARVRLPDGRDVVIDAKVSLSAYERSLQAAGATEREALLGQHVASLRAHVKRLAGQEYDQLEGVSSLDFVLMFVPIESAFSLAMEQDQRLYSEAFDKRIVIVTPTTLMMTLRVIHNVWRFDKQNRHAEEIARRAGAMYDKLRGLVEDMDTIGRQLETLQRTHRAALGKLVAGRGNLVRQAERFQELGAPVRQPLPEAVRERARADDD